MSNVSTRTAVCSVPQFLWDYSSTLAALLGRSSRIHFHDLDTGACSLVFQPYHETSPSGVVDRPSQQVVLDHVFSGQVFHSDKPVATSEIQRDLAVKILTKICNSFVDSSNEFSCFPPITTTFLFSGDCPLSYSQSGQFVFLESGAFNDKPIGCSQEVFKSKIDSCVWLTVRDGSNIRQKTGCYNEPLLCSANDSDCLDFSFSGSVQANTNDSDVLNSKPVPKKTNTVTVGREFNAGKFISVTESWIARFFTSLDSSEKRLESLVESTKCCLCAREVDVGKPSVCASLTFEPGRLILVLDGSLFCLPGVFALRQGGIVKSSVRFDHLTKVTNLRSVWVKPEFVSTVHLLSLLSFNVPSYCFLADRPNSSSVVGSAPERGYSCPQGFEFLSQVMRSPTLEAIDEFSDSPCRITLNEDVNMIGHDLQGVNCCLHLCSDLHQELSKSFFDSTDQDRPTILGAPYQVILEREDRTSVFGVSVEHDLIIHSAGTLSISICRNSPAA